MCNLADLFFLLTKNDIIVLYNKFPYLGVYHAPFPNLKDPRATFQNCKKILELENNLFYDHMTWFRNSHGPLDHISKFL